MRLNLRRKYVRLVESIASVFARRMFEHAIRGMSYKSVDCVRLYYKNDEEAAFSERSLAILKESDYSGYLTVIKHIKVIVCCGGLPSWNKGKSGASIGVRLGVYFDEFTPPRRKAIDERRYGCILLRCAILVRLLKQFQINTAKFGGGSVNKRISNLLDRRDIICCEKLDCKIGYVYALQRRMRH